MRRGSALPRLRAARVFRGFLDYFRICAPLAIGAIQVLALVHAISRASPLVYLLASLAYLVGVAVQLAAPDVYGTLIAPYLSEVRFQGDSIRGPNGLAVEPSMVGNVCAVLVAIPALGDVEWWRRRSALKWLLWASSGVAVLVTGSVTGVASCLMVAAFLYCRNPANLRPLRLIPVAASVVAGVVVLMATQLQGRIGDLVTGVSETPLWLLTELSVVMRYAAWLVSISHLPSAPFGDGIGSLTSAIVEPELAWWANTLDWNSYYITTLWTHIVDTSVGIGSLILRMGFIGLLLLGLVFWLVGRGRDGWLRAALVGTIILNVSLATPYLWLVVALALRNPSSQARSF